MSEDTYSKLNTTKERIINILIDMNNRYGPISDDYIVDIVEKCVDDVAENILETADPDHWNTDDVKLAFGRVLCDKLNIDR